MIRVAPDSASTFAESLKPLTLCLALILILFLDRVHDMALREVPQVQIRMQDYAHLLLAIITCFSFIAGGEGAHDFTVVAGQVVEEANPVVPEFRTSGIKISPSRVWADIVRCSHIV